MLKTAYEKFKTWWSYRRIFLYLSSITLKVYHVQDNVRNQLIQFELLLTTATFVVAIFGVVAGIFGMNFEIPMFGNPDAFKWVLLITGVSGIIIFSAFVWFFRYKRLMPL